MQRPARGWLLRTSLAIEGTLQIRRSATCACCRSSIEETSGFGYCRVCVWHQRIHTLALVVIAAALVALGRVAPNLVFAGFPYLGTVGHTSLVFAICALPALLVALFMNLWPADPVHGDWGPAVRFVGAERATRTVFHNRRYGLEVAESCGDPRVQDLKGPRAGILNLIVLVLVLPTCMAALAAYRLSHHHFVLYVDNASERVLRIETAEGRVLGRAAASQATAISIPMISTSLVARALDGTEVERIRIGNLDDILADKYESIYPDIEFDVASTFIWNLEQAHCYTATAHMYGTIGFGGQGHMHRERAFASNTSEPFKNAPSSIESPIGMGSVSELIRVQCPVVSDPEELVR